MVRDGIFVHVSGEGREQRTEGTGKKRRDGEDRKDEKDRGGEDGEDRKNRKDGSNVLTACPQNMTLRFIKAEFHPQGRRTP
ncbi:hypothetical protein C482_16683 [Natrialba chahannaoensis JCM 10990]|uniref:Uncharacterized protein n=1 Tax=Natrialba chahannaoensis JCM 10990 TaxID=1227492 RepID=M0A944_9EURY|nr:hypothetical protein [Natrialba chahannaoensis]ELY95300.1 hypothetical protein C482_16683 [Natrialba chahannaoensis JCM 10990]